MHRKKYFLVLLAGTRCTLLPAQENTTFEIGGIDVAGNQHSDARGDVLGFAEAGNVWKQAYQFSPFNLKPAAGPGIRLQLPVFGTIGFDYGIGFGKPELNGQRWTKYGVFNIVLGVEPE
ncbi:MAG: BamA/TamA family outer membrane protein [Phaeodactylibacter sp.]|nr:BamA/TamA family outer membrane protein [Phaeodactylibacter sp.]